MIKYMLLFFLPVLAFAQPDSATGGTRPVTGSYVRGNLHPHSLYLRDTLDFTGAAIRTDNALLNVYINDGGVSIACDTVEVWKRITGWYQHLDGGWDADTVKGEFTVPVSGLYRVAAQFSFSSNAANRTAHIALFQNEAKQVNCAAEMTIVNAAAVGGSWFTGVVYLAAAAKVTTRISVETGTATFSINHAQLVMEYIR